MLRIALVWCPLWAQAPLEIRVVEGEGVAYTVGSRATRGVTVEIVDSGGKPVQGALVRFELPATGASGTFPDGERIAAMTTGPDGRVEAWGMQWNRTVGPIVLGVAASKGTSAANARVSLSLTRAAIPVDLKGQSSHHSRKKLWIALAVAGAAGAAVLGVVGKSSSSSGAPTAVNPPQIGAPTISIGSP